MFSKARRHITGLLEAFPDDEYYISEDTVREAIGAVLRVLKKNEVKLSLKRGYGKNEKIVLRMGGKRNMGTAEFIPQQIIESKIFLTREEARMTVHNGTGG